MLTNRFSRPYRLALLLLLLAGTFLAGMVAQRVFGLGNLVAALRGPPPAPATIPPEYHGRLRIYLLAGQSNMEGGTPAPADYVSPPTDGRVFAFGPDYRWSPAAEPLSPTGVGPAVAFASALVARDTSLVIGLIPCARGGTNIAEWQPSRADGSLYAECVKRARAASVMGQISGVLFFQGENDAEGDPSDHPHDWATYFARTVEGFRRDLGPSMPVLFAQIGAGQDSLWSAVQAEQAAASLPGVAMIRTSDLPYAEAPHFTVEAYHEIGRRFALKYLALSHQLRGRPTANADPLPDGPPEP